LKEDYIYTHTLILKNISFYSGARINQLVYTYIVGWTTKGAGARDFHFFHIVQTIFGPTQPLIQWVLAAFMLKGKRDGT
jgi:hypothetical protein